MFDPFEFHWMKAALVELVLRYPEPTGDGAVVVVTETEAESGTVGRLSAKVTFLPDGPL